MPHRRLSLALRQRLGSPPGEPFEALSEEQLTQALEALQALSRLDVPPTLAERTLEASLQLALEAELDRRRLWTSDPSIHGPAVASLHRTSSSAGRAHQLVAESLDRLERLERELGEERGRAATAERERDAHLEALERMLVERDALEHRRVDAAQEQARHELEVERQRAAGQLAELEALRSEREELSGRVRRANQELAVLTEQAAAREQRDRDRISQLAARLHELERPGSAPSGGAPAPVEWSDVLAEIQALRAWLEAHAGALPAANVPLRFQPGQEPPEAYLWDEIERLQDEVERAGRRDRAAMDAVARALALVARFRENAALATDETNTADDRAPDAPRER